MRKEDGRGLTVLSNCGRVTTGVNHSFMFWAVDGVTLR